MQTDYLVIIPARYASSRFPGKPLVDIGGDHVHQTHGSFFDGSGPVEGGHFFRKLREERRHPLYEDEGGNSQKCRQRQHAVEKRMSYKVEPEASDKKESDYAKISGNRLHLQNRSGDPRRLVHLLPVLRRDSLQNEKVAHIDAGQNRRVEQSESPFQ